MRDGDPGVRGGRDRARDPRNDLERDAGRRQCLGLLAAAPEDERVAALEPHDTPARLAVLDEERVDLVLGHLDVPGGLADRDPHGVGGARSRSSGFASRSWTTTSAACERDRRRAA